jgi:hypothetical protein
MHYRQCSNVMLWFTDQGSWWNYPTVHTLVESMLFPLHFNEIMLNQRGIDVELTSVPSGIIHPLQ